MRLALLVFLMTNKIDVLEKIPRLKIKVSSIQVLKPKAEYVYLLCN